MTHLSLDLVGNSDSFFFVADLSRFLKARIPLELEAQFEKECVTRSWTNSFKFCLEQNRALSWLNTYEYSFLLYQDIQAGEHYELYRQGNVTHWRTIGKLAAWGLTSQEDSPEIGGFDAPAGAADEACEVISLCSKYGLEQGVTRWDEFHLILSCLWDADRTDIQDAVESLPLDVRFESALSLARRTKPMPQQYWA